MLHCKYIMLGLMCLSSALLYSADEGKELRSTEDGRLEFADCFDQKTALVAGSEKFYAPILVSDISEIGLLDRFKIGTPFFASKLMRSIIAFVEGYDQTLIQEVAENITKSIQPALLQKNTDWLLNLSKSWIGAQDELLDHALQNVIQGDAERYNKLKGTSLKIQALIQSSNKNFLPEKLDRIIEQFIGIGPCFKRTEFGSRVLSPRLYEYQQFKKLCSTNRSLDDDLAALSKAAEAASASHVAPFFVLNQERYKAFLAQEFEEQTK